MNSIAIKDLLGSIAGHTLIWILWATEVGCRLLIFVAVASMVGEHISSMKEPDALLVVAYATVPMWVSDYAWIKIMQYSNGLLPKGDDDE